MESDRNKVRNFIHFGNNILQVKAKCYSRLRTFDYDLLNEKLFCNGVIAIYNLYNDEFLSYRACKATFSCFRL